jgi:hypothetical protein
MRTTLDIDPDILQAAKMLAEAEYKTLGQVLSELVRKGLTQAAAHGLVGEAVSSPEMASGRPAAEAGQNEAGRRRR